MIRFFIKATNIPTVLLDSMPVLVNDSNIIEIDPGDVKGNRIINIIPNGSLEILKIFIDDIELPSYFLWVDQKIGPHEYYPTTRSVYTKLTWEFENPIVDWALLVKMSRNGVDINQYTLDRREYIKNIDTLLNKIDQLKKKYGV